MRNKGLKFQVKIHVLWKNYYKMVEIIQNLLYILHQY
jgi:hypothetical protein